MRKFGSMAKVFGVVTGDALKPFASVSGLAAVFCTFRLFESGDCCAIWTAIAWYVDAKPPNARHLLKFWAIYLPVAFFLRWMDVEIQDKLAIAAGMTIGNKMVQILTAA